MEKRDSLKDVLLRAAKRSEQSGTLTENRDALEDVFLRAAKREQQKRSHELVQSGARTQESMFFIAPSIIRTSTFRRRSDEF